jgi:hypothetical protein
MDVFEFKIAQVEESELPDVLKADQPTGEFKILYAICNTEEEALKKVDAYVAQTKYADIEDRKIVK